MNKGNRTITALVVAVFVLTSLLPLMLPSAGAVVLGRSTNETEPNNSFAQADELVAGEEFTGKVNLSDIRDVYKINVTAGKVWNVSVFLVDWNAAVPWEYNVHFEIIAPTQEVQVYHNWEERQLQTHSILVHATGYHYIWLYLNASSLETNYIITVNETDPITVGTGTHSGYIDANNGTYSDAWYKLTVAPDQGVRIVLTNPANGDFNLVLYNRWPHQNNYLSGTTYPFMLNQSFVNDTGNDEVCEGLAMLGTYYIKINGQSGKGQYSLQVNEASIFDDGDSTPDTAAFVAKSGVTLNTMDQSYDMFDWYEIHLDDGETVTATAELMSGQGKVYFFFGMMDQWFNINYWEYDTQKGGKYHWSSNPIDNVANIYNVGSVGDADYYFFVRAVYKTWEAGDSGFIPAHAMYRITWDLPDYGPETNGTIPDITMNEDESFTSLDLEDYFYDPELDALTYSFSPDPFPNVNVDIDQATGIVNITPDKDYNTGGDPVNITFKATDPDADWSEKVASMDTTLTIDPVNDGPTVLVPLQDINVSEDVPFAPIDLSNVFTDIDGDRLFYRVSGNDNIPISINQTTAIMSIGIVSKWFGSESITVTAEDPDNEDVPDTFNITVNHVNHDPTGVGGIVRYVYNVTEDKSENSLLVADLFEDVDIAYADDALVYYIDYPLGYAPPFHMEVVIDGDGFLSVVPETNFTGMEEVPLFARDLEGLKAMVIVEVTVRPVNDPPEIREVSPSTSHLSLEEGQTRKFELTDVFDVDGDYLKFKWYINDEFQSLIPVTQKSLGFETAYVASAGKYDAGNYTIRVVVSDDIAETSYTWTVDVIDVNRNPAGVSITEPTNNKKLEAGEKITLRAATATDPDGDTLTYTWRDETESKDLGTGASILFKSNKVGNHNIVLTVSDGRGGSTTATVNVKVVEASSGTVDLGGTMLYALIAIIIVVVIIVAVIAMKKKGGRRPADTQAAAADSYEAQLWGDKKARGPAREPSETYDAPPPEEPPAGEAAPAYEPEPEPEPEPEVATWTPGGASEPAPSPEEPKPGPPAPGPPQ